MVVIFLSVISPTTVYSLNINLVGELSDLDGDGNNAEENRVVKAAVCYWERAIQTQRSFTMNVGVFNSPPGGRAYGGITTMDVEQIPDSGMIRIDIDGDGIGWFVDPSPLDNLEFRKDQNNLNVLDSNIQHLDLLTAILHEMGHALGWHGNGHDPGLNPRFTKLMSQQITNLKHNLPVYLRASNFKVRLWGNGFGRRSEQELSHTADPASLMYPKIPAGLRVLPGALDILMFKYAFGDTVNVLSLDSWPIENDNSRCFLN